MFPIPVARLVDGGPAAGSVAAMAPVEGLA
jgi:hypothetical protein